ncbi:MAG: tetratricopeptide repeat protein [Methanobacteriota archaeon]|nr:MAG: tetratricopeptide repeat protein [Euryarchaeota archaeon]
MPLFRRKKKGHQVRVKKYYRGDGTSFELPEDRDKDIRKLDAEMNWDDSARLKEIGEACILNKYFDVAEMVFERVMELDPDDDDAVIQFSSALLNQKRWDEAEEIISNYFSTDPTSSVAHQFLAVIHEKKGDPQKSAAEMYKALECDPNNENALWMAYWRAHKSSGDEGALQEMQDLGEKYPKAWGPIYIMARHFEDLDPKNAKRFYESALQRDDSDAILISFTAFLGKAGRYRDMIKIVEASRKKRSVDFRVLFNLGEAYLEEGEIDKAYDVSLELQGVATPPYKKRLRNLIHRIHDAREN